MIPIFIVLFSVALLFSTVTSSFINVSRGGEYKYDEVRLQDYADMQYAEVFGETDDYEDNLLLVFLVEDENYYDYAFIAWTGNHIVDPIYEMFGNEHTEFGRAIQSSSINSDTYKHSLSRGITSVITKMEDNIANLNLEKSYSCKSIAHNFDSKVINNTSINNFDEEMINSALASFTGETGIPVVVVVEDIEEVFPKSIEIFDIIVVIVAIGLFVLAIFLIVKAVKAAKEKKEDDGSYKGSSQQSERIDFDKF